MSKSDSHANNRFEVYKLVHDKNRENLKRHFSALNSEDWDLLFFNLACSAVAGDFFSRVSALDLDRYLPRDVLAKFKDYAFLSSAREKDAAAQLARLDAALAAAGQQAVILKGAAFTSAEIYPDKGARMFSDIDILASEGSLECIANTLESIGYSMRRKVPRPLDDWMKNGGERHAPPFIHPDEVFRIELHQSTYSRFASHSYPIDQNKIHVNASKIQGFDALKRPSNEHMLIHLFYHNQIQDKLLARNHFPIGAAVDLSSLMEKKPLDWEYVESSLEIAGLRGEWNFFRAQLTQVLPMPKSSHFGMGAREKWEYLLHTYLLKYAFIGPIYYVCHRLRVNIMADIFTRKQRSSFLKSNSEPGYTHMLPVYTKIAVKLKEKFIYPAKN